MSGGGCAPTDEEVRIHMRRCPDHEVIVGTDDQWHCLTCESEESETVID